MMMMMMNVRMYTSSGGGSYMQPAGKGCVKAKACLREACCGVHAGTLERVLRYPDGRERRIRYPCPDGDDVQQRGDSLSGGGRWQGRGEKGLMYSGDDDDDDNGYSGNFVQTEKKGKRRESVKSEKTCEDSCIVEKANGMAGGAMKEEEEVVKNVLESKSPLELLKYLTSAEYKEEQEREWQAVKDSFDIHHGCPWPIPKPVYTVVVQQEDGAGQVHTLRTRIAQEEVENELNTLLGFHNKRKNNNKENSAVIRCSSLVDGVVVFEDEDRADEYGQIVQGLKNGNVAVHIAEHDSHDLFRNVQEAKGVVVVIRRDGQVPNMQQLAAVLRNPDSNLNE